jgi:two-component system LytT family sensor kinase
MNNIQKLLLLVLIICCSGIKAQAQINWGDYSQSAEDSVLQHNSAFGLIMNMRKDNNSFWSDRSSSLLNRYLDIPGFRQLHSRSIIARTTFDTAKVHFFLQGITKANAFTFEYQVQEYHGSVVVPWTRVQHFSNAAVTTRSGIPLLGYLGGYSPRWGKALLIDVRKAGTDKILSTALVVREHIQPQITHVYNSKTFDVFLRQLQYPWADGTVDTNSNQLLNSDPVQGSAWPSNNSNLIFVLKSMVFNRAQIQYQLMRGHDIVIPWKQNDYDNSFIWLKEQQPGKYKLQVKYVAQPEHVTSFDFVIEPLWYQGYIFKIAAGIFLAAVAGALFFVMQLYKQKRLTRFETANKTKLQLELKAIRAQLNPHFVFNALSSIQGLVNKQDIKAANIYLADFAKLMRDSLKRAHHEEVSLEQEMATLDTYLRLEKLRFDFSYDLMVDGTINPAETNIPTLLLQPLIENSIKHGISHKGNEGKIIVDINMVNDDLIIEILDNGDGFDHLKESEGYGLKLTADRIKLLNELKPDQQIEWITDSSPAGTITTLKFKFWFL